MSDARQLLREEVTAAIRSAGLLGNGDRERLVRIEERHNATAHRVEAIEHKIDVANTIRQHEIDNLRGEMKADFLRKTDVNDVVGDVRKVRWLVIASVVAALLIVVLKSKGTF